VSRKDDEKMSRAVSTMYEEDAGLDSTINELAKKGKNKIK
jgi:hypothetical protein